MLESLSRKGCCFPLRGKSHSLTPSNISKFVLRCIQIAFTPPYNIHSAAGLKKPTINLHNIDQMTENAQSCTAFLVCFHRHVINLYLSLCSQEHDAFVFSSRHNFFFFLIDFPQWLGYMQIYYIIYQNSIIKNKKGLDILISHY